MSLWPLLIPLVTSVLFVIFMLVILPWWLRANDDDLASVDEHRRFLNTLGGGR